MTQEERLELLKADLQMTTGAFDNYLKHLLETADRMIRQEGILLTESAADETLRIMYAAYLYRRRADPTAVMPRMLRYALNNALFRQKAVT